MPAKTLFFDAHTSVLRKIASDLFETTVEPIQDNDVLLVIDMQNDFVPVGTGGVKGCGAFGVSEGDAVVPVIVSLINAASKKPGCIIAASRDYHPKNHMSFGDVMNGKFPPHCIQGSPGSEFVPAIRDALNEAKRKNPPQVKIVYKGYADSVDSFGAFPYNKERAEERGMVENMGVQLYGCSPLNWTGSHALFCSYQDKDVNAPPDVMSVYDKESFTLVDTISAPKLLKPNEPNEKRLLICGLALDFCVLDSALNSTLHGFSKVKIVLDAARAAHMVCPESTANTDGHPKLSTQEDIISGFITPPHVFAEKLRKCNVKFVLSSQLTTN